MFHFVLVGLNHRTAELDVRQLASFEEAQLPEALQQLLARPGIHEAMIISTCNRVEILSSVEQPSDGIDSLEQFLSAYSRIDLPQLRPKLYHYAGDQAIRHVFRVASSLDSMILGEPQILGQIKSSYSTAMDAQTIGTYLNNLLQAAFHTAKRVRSETSIGEYSVSVSSASVELVRTIFGDLHQKSILIVGAGKMGEASVRNLAAIGAKAIYVANRSLEAAQDLAVRFHGMAVPFAELRRWISQADIVITSTGASDILMDFPMAQLIMHERKNAPIVFIDISVPRNVDPKVGTLDNVFCYDIDDLEAVVEGSLHERLKAAAAAEKIVDQEVQNFNTKLKSMDVAPVVVQVQDRIEEICSVELQRSLRKMGPQGPKQMQELEAMVSRIAAKIAHPLVMQLRNSQQDPLNQDAYVDIIKRLFKLQNDTN